MSPPTTRAERTLATRQRMVKAAYDHFCRHGYLGTVITAVAADAGVAVPTIYYTFGTKAALLGEALGAAIAGFDEWRKPPPDPINIVELLPRITWWSAFEGAATSAEALGIFVDHGVDILQRVAPLVAAMHGAAGDAEAVQVVVTGEERRVESYREAMRVVAAKPGGLRTGMSVSTATDIVVALFSADLYRALAVGRSWSHRRCAAFFRSILESQLLGSDPLPGSAVGSPRPGE